MSHPPQEEPLELSHDVGWCRACGCRRVLCAFGTCLACHDDSSKFGRRDVREAVGELCCGWWKTGPLDEAWRCPTCGRVHTAARGGAGGLLDQILEDGVQEDAPHG